MPSDNLSQAFFGSRLGARTKSRRLGLASAGNDAERCIRMITQKRATASHPATRSRRNDVLVAVAAGIAIALLLAGTSYAGKQTVPPRLALATVSGDGAGFAAAGIEPSLGDWVTFSTTYPTSVKNPRIEVLCYQGGALTFGMAGGVDYSFQLGGAGSQWLWSGGEADCTANLFYFGWKGGKQTYNLLASTRFHAGA